MPRRSTSELADRSERIGPPSPTESYLSIQAIIDAARRSGAEAIHPGYGFLSENAAFAMAVEDAGLVFVGPPAETLASLGNKLAARRSATAAGVPIVPGTELAVEDGTADLSATVGFPLMLKAAAGGGGRGMRRVESVDDVPDALAAARREALSAFGDGTIYAERVISPARHVEVQLLGDRHGNLAVLGERDCSVQRRHQKLVEESPSPAVDEPTREALLESARKVAGSVEFHNAATVEFLLDADRQPLLPRDEHPPPGGAWGDRAGDRAGPRGLADPGRGGRAPSREVLAPGLRGHAIEVRALRRGPVRRISARRRPHHGVEHAGRAGHPRRRRVEADTDLRPEYDPLLAKLMVHADDRAAAIARLRRALDETLIGGVQTDAGFLRWVVDDEAFASGATTRASSPTDGAPGRSLTAEDAGHGRGGRARRAASATEARRASSDRRR